MKPKELCLLWRTVPLWYLQSDDWKAKNTLEQEAIVPRIRPVEVASRSLSLELQPRSFGVYRLRISTQSK